MNLSKYQVIDHKTYDFTPYQDPIDICDYLGFIDCDGNFYHVRKIDDVESEYPHNTWARHFLTYHKLNTEESRYTSSLTLVKVYGFILCAYRHDTFHGDGKIFIIPNVDGICNYDMCDKFLENEKQLETLHRMREYEEEKRRDRKK